MQVELFAHMPVDSVSGIGRYMRELHAHLQERVPVRFVTPIDPPLTRFFSPLHFFPLGLRGHQPGSIVHFTQIMGCAIMLYRPYHPSVATVHDLGFLELPEEWEMLDGVARQMLRLSLAGLKRVDMIVADSEFTHHGIIRHLGIPPERAVTIYPGIDHELFRPISDAREMLVRHYSHLAAIAPAPWLLYVGSELPRKNMSTLLQAIALVRKQIPNIRLIKVGSAGGEHFRRETSRVISELGLEDHIVIFEDVPEAALPLFYGAADAFVTASRLEGFGLPALEAMACGTPVVCSNAGALPEVVGDAGFLVEPHDARGFAEAMVQVWKDGHLRNRLIEIGLQRCRLFAWEQAAAETVGVYHGLRHRATTHSKVEARSGEPR